MRLATKRRIDALRMKARVRGIAFAWRSSPAGLRIELGDRVYEGDALSVLAAADLSMPPRRPGAPLGNRNACRANRIARAAREAYQWR